MHGPGGNACLPRLVSPILAWVLLLLVVPDAHAAAQRSDAKGPFGRGLNVTRLFDTPKRLPGVAGAFENPPFKPWRQQVREAELDQIRQAGFDFIRLPIDPAPLLASEDRQRGEVLDHILGFVAAARARDLGVVLDMHPRPDNPEWNTNALLQSLETDKFRRFGALIVTLARRLAARADDRLALELLNEPQRECTRSPGPDWTGLQRSLLRAARDAAPAVNLVVTGTCLSSVDGLAHLDPAIVAGRHVFVMVHFYEPHAFTHQGASWSPPARFLAGLSYPIDPTQRATALEATRRWIDTHGKQGHGADAKQQEFALKTVETYFSRPVTPATIRARLEVAAAWADAAGLPRSHVMVGEFGVLRSGGIRLADQPDRARAAWLRTVARSSEELGFSWAIWGYDGAFGIVSEDGARTLEPLTLDALFGHRRRD